MSPKTAEKNKTAYIKTRIEPEMKERAEGILKAIGMTTTQAIALYYQQIWLSKGIPFDVRVPNKETQDAIEKAELGKELHKYESVDHFFKEMGV